MAHMARAMLDRQSKVLGMDVAPNPQSNCDRNLSKASVGVKIGKYFVIIINFYFYNYGSYRTK